MKLMAILTLAACTLAIGGFAADTIIDNSTNLTFPREVSFDHNGKQYELEATGVATRKKLIIKIYSVASYLQKGAATGGDKLQAILSEDNAKQLTMKWVRDISPIQLKEAYDDSFHRVFPEQQYAELQTVIKEFLNLFSQPAKKGEEYIIRSIPGGEIVVLINGKKVGSVTNPAFAQGLWKVWFGDKSIVKRSELLSQMQ